MATRHPWDAAAKGEELDPNYSRQGLVYLHSPVRPTTPFFDQTWKQDDIVKAE
jgi:hypothetical protein